MAIHPVETSKYLLETPAMVEVFEQVVQVIENRVPGAVCWGYPRFGKTRALKYFRERLLPKRYENRLYIGDCLALSHRAPSEKEFYREIAWGLQLEFYSTRDAGRLARKIVEFLYERRSECEDNRVVLFIDNANNYREEHYGWLSDLYNMLDRLNVSLVVFLFGQEELEDKRRGLVKEKRTDIIERFMGHHFRYRGLTGIEDTAYCLGGYDVSDFPIGSGITYTQHFIPNEYKDGFRLGDCAAELWVAFEQVAEESGIKLMEMPMQRLVRSCEYQLKALNAKAFSEKPSISAWHRALSYAGHDRD